MSPRLEDVPIHSLPVVFHGQCYLPTLAGRYSQEMLMVKKLSMYLQFPYLIGFASSLSINPHFVFLRQLIILICTYTLLVDITMHNLLHEHFDRVIVEAGISMVKLILGHASVSSTKP